MSPARPPARPGTPAERGVLAAFAALVACLFAIPFAYLVVRNLEDAGAFWSAFAGRSPLPLGRSVLLAVTVSLAAAGLGTAAAWAVARTDLPGRRAFAVLLPLPLVIPSFVGAFALVAAFSSGGLAERLLAPLGVGELPAARGFWAAFAVLTLLTYPYVYLPAVVRLRGLPRSLEESARLLGLRPRTVFRRVVWPQARGAVAAGGLLVFLYVVSDFGAVQLLRYDTLTRVIYSTRLVDSATALALSLQLGLLALAIVLVERMLARARPERPAVAEGGLFRVPLGRWKPAALAALGGLLALALVVPVAVLAYWAGRGLAQGGTGVGGLAADVGNLLRPALNTAFASVAAGALAVAALAPVAYVTTRYRSRLAEAANAVVVAGFALPGLVIALALVFWTLAAPRPLSSLYQTLPLLLFAYVVHFGAQALRASQAAVAGVSLGLDEAARVLGARRPRRLARVELPLMLPGLLAAGGLVLLSTMKELPATLLLAPPGFQTLATKTWTATEDAFFAEASLAALLLVLLSGILSWALVVRPAREAP